MNTMKPPDPVGTYIDGALSRLPEWRPPPDFTARLGAAAARQAEQQAVAADPALSRWLEQITRLTPAMLGSAALAITIGWIVPWSQLSLSAMVWTCVLAMASAGAVLTLRVLRAS